MSSIRGRCICLSPPPTGRRNTLMIFKIQISHCPVFSLPVVFFLFPAHFLLLRFLLLIGGQQRSCPENPWTFQTTSNTWFGAVLLLVLFYLSSPYPPKQRTRGHVITQGASTRFHYQPSLNCHPCSSNSTFLWPFFIGLGLLVTLRFSVRRLTFPMGLPLGK